MSKHIEVRKVSIILHQARVSSNVNGRSHGEPYTLSSQFLDQWLVGKVYASKFDLLTNNFLLLLVLLREGEQSFVLDCALQVSQQWLRVAAHFAGGICCTNYKERVLCDEIVPLRLCIDNVLFSNF